MDNAAAQKLLPVRTGFRLTLRKSDQLLKPIGRLKGVLVLSGGQAYLIDVPLGARPQVGPGGALHAPNSLAIRTVRFLEKE
jgi:hypothetical protein